MLPQCRAWNYFEKCALATPYNATAADIAYGDVLMSQWQNMTQFHSIPASSGMLPVNSVPGFPGNYNVVIQNNTAPSMVENYGAARCAALTAAPIFLGQQKFWCTN